MTTIEKVVEPFLSNSAIDRVVLGCTHFPFLKEELNAVLGAKVQLIDSGSAIARRTKYILNSLSQSTSNLANNTSFFVFTKDNDTAHHLIPHLKKHGFDEVTFIDR